MTAGGSTSELSWWAVSMPSMPGMRTSSSTTSGVRSTVSCSACSPFAASPAISTVPISSSRLRSRSRAGCSSSTINTRSFMPLASSCRQPLAIFDVREAQRHDVLIVEPAGFHERAIAVHERQPLADIRERELVAFAIVLPLGHGVAHDDGDQPAGKLAVDGDDAAMGLRLDAVINRVLEQRLQQQPWHQREHRQLIDVPYHLQPISEPQLLDALVDARDFQLLLEGDGVALLAEVRAEEVCQVLHGLLRERRIRACERGDGVHAVEQEVRTDARLQRV